MCTLDPLSSILHCVCNRSHSRRVSSDSFHVYLYVITCANVRLISSCSICVPIFTFFHLLLFTGTFTTGNIKYDKIISSTHRLFPSWVSTLFHLVLYRAMNTDINRITIIIIIIIDIPRDRTGQRGEERGRWPPLPLFLFWLSHFKVKWILFLKAHISQPF